MVQPVLARPAAPVLPGAVDSVLDLIGGTPLVRLRSLAAGLPAQVVVKLEGRNPGGSAKDRPALEMVRAAEANGDLAPGATIVESTSGNTGIGLALVGRVTGHPVVIVHGGAMSAEKRALLALYGAELVEADWTAGPEDPANARAVADRIAAQRPGAWRSHQYDNPANRLAHYRHTGPEIWAQTGGAVTHLVAGIGTGGTISGTGRYLKEVSGGAVRVIGVNPVGSTYGGGPAGTIAVEGVGTTWPRSHWPTVLDRSVADEIRTVPDARVAAVLRRLALDEALLLGPSSAMAVAAALDVAAAAAEQGSVVVVMAPDGAGNYLTELGGGRVSLTFGWFLGAGFGVQGWGDPTYGQGYDWKQPAVYQDAARAFEAAALDLLIIEDGVAVPDTYRGTAEVNLAAARFVPKHDPIPLVPYLLGATSRLGIVPTLSASFTEPYTAARLLATLQHFAQGRLGLNIVTSGSDLAAQNYGLEKQIEHDLRYDRADEWIEVVQALWRSWEPGAVVEDTERGVFADFSKVHTIDHEGRFFRVRGPLNALPPAQEPVLVQAGASGRGQAFAGRHAEVVLALASTAPRMRAHRDDVRSAAAAAGRDADEVRVLFVVNPIPTSGAAETAEVRDRRATLTQAAIDEQLQSISYLTNVDFARFDLDAPLPEIATNSNRGTLENFVRSAPAGATLRQVLAARAKADGLAIIGTPTEITDRLGELAEGSGADGFLITGQVHPANVARTLDPLVPALRDAGLLKRELGDGGLRANLADRG